MFRLSSYGGHSDTAQQHLARWILATFLLTFLFTRILVLSIMTRRVPDVYVHVGGTHIHHLNFGIFLLSGVGAYLLFGQPKGRRLTLIATLYAIGLALTYDEFGMWLHLGGSYWQRASFDAVGVIAALLGLIAYAPSVRHFRLYHWATAVALVIVVLVFGGLLRDSFKHAHRIIAPKILQIEAAGPT
jgi:hypothetical protein